MQGQTHPKLNIEYKISHRRLHSIPDQLLVAIEVIPTNVGNHEAAWDQNVMRIYIVYAAETNTEIREGNRENGQAIG
jgi:hypothetical protein